MSIFPCWVLDSFSIKLRGQSRMWRKLPEICSYRDCSCRVTSCVSWFPFDLLCACTHTVSISLLLLSVWLEAELVFLRTFYYFFPVYRIAELFSSRTDAHLRASPKQSLCVVLTCPHEINITCKKEIKAPKRLRTSRLWFLHIIPWFRCVPFIRWLRPKPGWYMLHQKCLLLGKAIEGKAFIT